MTQSTKRTDPHRPSEIIPEDYQYVLSYHFGSSPRTDYGLRQLSKFLEGIADDRVYGDPGRCTVCGAPHNTGDVWEHVDGDVIFVGWICAEKYSMICDRGLAVTEIKACKKRTARQRKLEAREVKCRDFLEQHDGLEEALTECTHYIVADIADKFRRYATLSDKQIALVKKLHREQLEHVKQREDEPVVEVPIETGRQTIEGTVVSVKSNDWGTLKMVVKIHEENGIWLCYGTCPSAFSDARDQRAKELDTKDFPTLRGARVRFDAKLKAGRDAHFAFFSRPTKAQVLEWPNQEETQ